MAGERERNEKKAWKKSEVQTFFFNSNTQLEVKRGKQIVRLTMKTMT